MTAFVTLSDVAEINPRIRKALSDDAEVSFLPMASVSEDGRVFAEESKIFGEVKKGYTYFERNDVLVAKITPCFENGKAAYLDKLEHEIGFGSTEFHVVRPDPKVLDGKYLFYLLWNPAFRRAGEASMTGSAGQKRVPADFLRKATIPLPQLQEQKRIAAILDKADAIRRKRQQAIQLADQFLRAVFLDMFGNHFDQDTYEKGVRKSIAELTTYIDYRGKTPEKADSGVPLITAKNVKYGYISEEPKEFIPEDNYEAWMTRGEPLENDVLFTTEAPLGNAALLGKYDKVAVGQRLVALRSRGEVTQEYLMFCLLHPFVQAKIHSLSSGSTAKGIRTKELYTVELPVPDIHLQRHFSKIYQRQKNSVAKWSSQHGDADILFRSLEQRAFSGQL